MKEECCESCGQWHNVLNPCPRQQEDQYVETRESFERDRFGQSGDDIRERKATAQETEK